MSDERNDGTDRLSTALLHHGCAALGIAPPSGPGETAAPFVADGNVRFAGRAIDSLDLVDLIGAIEDEFDLTLLDEGVFDEINSIDRLATFVRAEAPGLVEAYVARWSPGPRGGSH